MRTWTAMLALMLALGAGLAATPAPMESGPAGSGQQPARQGPEEFRVRVKVELVATPVTVFDTTGEFVYGLTRDDFALWDNNVPQQISQFEFSSPPISLVLLLNTSSRIKPLLERVRSTGILFQSYILGEEGEGAVITFDDQVRVAQNFTSESEKIEKAIQAIKAGGDQTRLADALDTAIRLLLPRPAGRRRVIVIISEPRDLGSESPLGELIRTAQLADITIYTLALSYAEALWKTKPQNRPAASSPYPPGVFPTPPRPGQAQTPTTEQQNVVRPDLLALIQQILTAVRTPLEKDVLEVLATATAGVHDDAGNQPALQAAINRIGQELHSQYLLAYRPSNLNQPGYHEIRVRVRRTDVFIRARPGYYLTPPE